MAGDFFVASCFANNAVVQGLFSCFSSSGGIGSVFAGDVRHLRPVSARSRAKMAYIFSGDGGGGRRLCLSLF